MKRWNRAAGADELVRLPLRRALQLRQPGSGLITHSDRGGQYIHRVEGVNAFVAHQAQYESGRRSLRQCVCRVVVDWTAEAAA